LVSDKSNANIDGPSARGTLYRSLTLTLLTGVLFAVVCAHISVSKSVYFYTGLLAPLDRAFDLIFALTLIALTLCVGRSLGRLFALEFVNRAEEFSFSVFLGTGVVGLAVLFLGLLGLLRPWAVLVLIALSILFTRRELTSTWELIKAALQSATSTRERRIVTSLFVCLVAIFVMRSATPPHAPDESIYHLAVTSQFVREGRVFPSYDNSLGNLPFLVHMIYALCLLVRSDISAKLFSLFLAVTTAIALYGFCNRFLTRRIGVFALFAFFAAGMVVEVGITTRIDVTLAGILFLATYAMLNFLKTGHNGWLWTSAVLGGFSLGIKPSAGIWLFMLGVMYLVERLVVKKENWRAFLSRGLIYMAIAAAIASPWYVKNYVWFQNPVYPMVTGEVADFGPWGVRYFDAEDERKLDVHFSAARSEIPEISLRQESALADAINARIKRHPMRLWEFFTRPRAYQMGESLHYPNYLFLLIPLLVLLKPSRTVLWLLGLSLVFVFSITSTVWIARFLLPAYPSLTIVVSYILVHGADHLRSKISFADRLPTYVVAIALSTVLAACVLSIRAMNTMGFLTGRISRHEFMTTINSYHAVDFINRQTPPDARVMCLGVQVNYEIQRDHLADETWFQTKWKRLLVRNDSLEKVNEDLKRQGYTHILYSEELLEFAAYSGLEGSGGMGLISAKRETNEDSSRKLGPEYQLLRNWTTFTLYRMKFLETVYADANGFQVFKIK